MPNFHLPPNHNLPPHTRTQLSHYPPNNTTLLPPTHTLYTACQKLLFNCVAGPHTMLCCTRHLSAVRAVWSALSTQCTVNLEHSNALSTQCTRSNGHSALSATHLTGTECSVCASCVVPCVREPRRPPWVSLSLSLPLTRALPRLDLPALSYPVTSDGI